MYSHTRQLSSISQLEQLYHYHFDYFHPISITTKYKSMAFKLPQAITRHIQRNHCLLSLLYFDQQDTQIHKQLVQVHA